MGCLPPSDFFYVIEFDASTTVRVANMIERIYHLSSRFSGVKSLIRLEHFNH